MSKRLIFIVLLVSLPAVSCGWLSGAGRSVDAAGEGISHSVEAVGEGAGHAISATGDAIGDAARETEDAID